MTRQLNSEELKFAKEIEATHTRENWYKGLFRNVSSSEYEYWNKSESKWLKAQSPTFASMIKIDFTPLDEEVKSEGIVVYQYRIPEGCSVRVEKDEATIEFDGKYYFTKTAIAYEKTMRAIRLLVEAKEGRRMEHKYKIGDTVRHVEEDIIYEITELPGYSEYSPEYYQGLDHSDGEYGMFKEEEVELVSDEENKKDGTPLTWPVDPSLIGRKVRFDGYVTGDHSHWDFVVGEEYLIANKYGDIGPVNIRGGVPSRNFENDFKFTLLPTTEDITEQLLPHTEEDAVDHIQTLLTSNLAGEISVYITADAVRVYWKNFEFEVDAKVSLEKIIETIIILEGQLVNE